MLTLVQHSLETPIGTVEITATHLGIREVTIDPIDDLENLQDLQPIGDPPHGYLADAVNGLHEFFRGKRVSFLQIPLDMEVEEATPFQKAVWEALRRIPRAQVRTYGQVAQAIGRPGAAAAVGQACNKNPVPLIIPCHRVIAASGLGGYAHGGTRVKKALLRLEGFGE